MSFDLFFSSKVNRKFDSEHDLRIARELQELPFEERKKRYKELKQQINNGVRLERGEFIFVRQWDQRLNAYKCNRWRRNHNRYCGSANVVGGGFTAK